MMMHTQIDDRNTVTVWVALGAPLLGVPLMVALLALTAHVKEAPALEVEAGIEVEQVEFLTVDQSIEPRLDDLEPPFQS